MAELLMPKIGLAMTEGLLTEWAVSPGNDFSEAYSSQPREEADKLPLEADCDHRVIDGADAARLL